MGGRTLFRAVVLATTVLVGLGHTSARADGLVEAATDIERLLHSGDDEGAMRAAREFLRMVTRQTGLGVTNAQFTQAPATGFGVYEPRATNLFQPGEPIYAYVEVYGFTLTEQPNGASALQFDVSFTLDTPDGRQVTDQMVPMGNIVLSSYSAPVDGFFHLTYQINGALGDYILRTHVVDHVSGEAAEFALPIVFEEATPMDETK